MPQPAEEKIVAVVGAGPRGTSFLERLLAHIERTVPVTPLRVVVFDPAPHGPGRVWDPGQSPLYLMNTPARYPTAAPSGDTREELPPSSVSCSFAEWRASQGGCPASAGTESAGPEQADADHTDADFPSRAAYGEYLSWLHTEAAGRLAALGVAVEHRSTAVTRCARHDGGYLLATDGGDQYADAVVLAVGHIPARLNEVGQRFTQAAGELGLRYVPPAVPTDVDYEELPAGENVLVRGMGLNFFDLMIQVTAGRGGEFRQLPGGQPGQRLEYVPSGREPRIIAGSRRGTPYRAKSAASGFIPEGVELVHFTDEAIDEAERRHDLLDFRAHLWPLILQDVLHTYYRLDSDAHPALPERPAQQSQPESPAQGRTEAEKFVRSLGRPFDGASFLSHADYQQHMLTYLEDDAATSAAGTASPVKMAIGVLHAARMKLKELIADGRVSQASRVGDIEGWFESLVEGTASGPPLQRIEELVALARAGVVEFLGPDPVFDVDRETGRFTAESPWVGAAEPYRAGYLVEAMMPANRVLLSESPLVAGLLEDGLSRPQELIDAEGALRAGKGFDVTERPHQLIDAEGNVCDGLYVLGLQLSSVQWGTAIAAEAGGTARGSARTLADADAAACAVLQNRPGGA